jgi:tetratricopeptide (TPR) repeat protein
MKKIKRNYLTSVVVAAFLLSSCGGLNKMVDKSSDVSYQVQPNPLEMHAGQVEVTIDTKFPEKYFNKKAVVVATPVLKYEGGQTEFEATTLQGEKVEANNKVISYDGGGYSYTGKIPYTDEMLRSGLYVEMSAQIKEKTPIEIPGIKIADGVIATPALVAVNPKTILVGDKFQRIIPESLDADIHYVINKSNVRDSELKSEDIVSLQDKIKEASQAERKEFKGANISAYASPDGPYDLNEGLAEDRQESAQRYMKRILKKAEVSDADAEGFMSLASTAEDWEGFKKLMEESDIQDKELILRVLSMYSDPVVREKEIKNISAAFKEIAEKVLPKLRRSMLNVNIDKIGYSDEEIAELAKTNPDTLNLEEILYAATLTEDLEEKLAIYQKAAENFPECFRAINNVGHVYVKLGKVAEAKKAFMAAKELKENDVIKNNLGAIALLEGDLAKAEELFASAMGAGDVVNYNLGIIKIKQADYDAAVNYFGNEPSFNAALAQLLSGDTEKSLNTLNQLGDVDCPMVYYLKAVASARSDREEGVLNNLRTAVGKKSELKEHAKKDLEFAKYSENEAFTSIVE